MPSKNNPHTSGYFNVNFIPCLIALLITQGAHREYSSVNDINDIYSSIMSCCWFDTRFCHKLGECFIYIRKLWNVCLNYLELFPLPCSTQGKSFHRLCARFCAVIIVDFYIDDFIFALFIFMKDGKAVNYNGSKIIGLINLKCGKRTACRDNFLPKMRYFPEKLGKGQQRGINPNLFTDRIFIQTDRMSQFYFYLFYYSDWQAFLLSLKMTDTSQNFSTFLYTCYHW